MDTIKFLFVVLVFGEVTLCLKALNVTLETNVTATTNITSENDPVVETEPQMEPETEPEIEPEMEPEIEPEVGLPEGEFNDLGDLDYGWDPYDEETDEELPEPEGGNDSMRHYDKHNDDGSLEVWHIVLIAIGACCVVALVIVVALIRRQISQSSYGLSTDKASVPTTLPAVYRTDMCPPLTGTVTEKHASGSYTPDKG